jgi:ABC-type transporter Mla subunit MlaD
VNTNLGQIITALNDAQAAVVSQLAETATSLTTASTTALQDTLNQLKTTTQTVANLVKTVRDNAVSCRSN